MKKREIKSGTEVKLLTGSRKDYVGTIAGKAVSNSSTAKIVPIYNKTRTRVAVYCDSRIFWIAPKNLKMW